MLSDNFSTAPSEIKDHPLKDVIKHIVRGKRRMATIGQPMAPSDPARRSDCANRKVRSARGSPEPHVSPKHDLMFMTLM